MRITIILGIFLSGCANIGWFDGNKRQENYLACVRILLNDGVKPELVESLCNKTMGD